MFKLSASAHRSTTSSACVVNFQHNVCCLNRFALLILSLFCIQIVLTQQAVALIIPTLVASSTPAKSLVMISQEFNVDSSSSKMASSFEQEPSFKQAVDVLTPGQQIINAIPDKERGDFIIYQLAAALKRTFIGDTEQILLKNLGDIEEFYGNKLTTLENVPIYENFSADLLQWLEQKFNLTQENVYTQLRSRSLLWCTSQDVCYGLSDIGCYCCPF